MKIENQIVVYQPNEITKLDVRLAGESVWLTQQQMSMLFAVKENNITYHIKEIYRSRELDAGSTTQKIRVVRQEGNRSVSRSIDYYNLDMIISVGYRVNSANATAFRRWATRILKEYLLRGVAYNARLEQLEDRVDKQLLKHDRDIIDLKEKVDFIVRTELPPPEQVLMDGEMLTAEVAIERIVKTAHKRLILIDGWCDAKTLLLLGRRADNVKCTLYLPGAGGRDFAVSLRDYNTEFPSKKITVKACANIHDRFLIVDNTVYHLGASLKDSGHRLSAIMCMSLSPTLILSVIKPQLSSKSTNSSTPNS